MFAAGGVKPLVQDCQELGALLLLQPQCLVVSVEVKPQQRLPERILAFALEELFLEYWVVAIVDVSGEDVVDASHYCRCDMVEMVTGCWDDNTHEIVHVDLKTVAARAVHPSGCREGSKCRVPPHMFDKLV